MQDSQEKSPSKESKKPSAGWYKPRYVRIGVLNGPDGRPVIVDGTYVPYFKMRGMWIHRLGGTARSRLLIEEEPGRIILSVDKPVVKVKKSRGAKSA
ncbi:hypothetical protein [Stenotrophomonas sp. PS02289]|uniref:hypothetical protein n=1 Tax=Stenotrophomonas sp. PS02289 TaxID=2991422 RepID=UPI00249A8A6D|nr:hypothetical protein [Stenotrophomonas sp. PS02289]